MSGRRKQFKAKVTRKPYHEQVADKIITQLKTGTAPWQRPWEAGPSQMPHNPTTDRAYRGVNVINLLCEGRSDPRWMTYKQATAVGAQINKGEHGTSVQYWKYADHTPKLDDAGKPVLDDSGQPVTTRVQLERAKCFYAVVFNAEQIDGLPALQRKAREWDPIERVEGILQKSGAQIEHGGNRALYRPSTDTITLPPQGQFPSADRYYATALHELAHWTGHASRMDRDLAHPFGSEGYAREELRAEIASMMLGTETGIGHDPGQHAAYVDSWIKVLQRDPTEILVAASVADKIQQYVLGLEQQQQQQQDDHQEQRMKGIQHVSVHDRDRDPKAPAMQEPMQGVTGERTYLVVPYAERGAAKQAGARWDAAKKSWYAPATAKLDRLQRWVDGGPASAVAAAASPREEFADVMRSMGLVVSGEHPIMDGGKHAVIVEGNKRGDKSGFYVGHLDGHPAGFIRNHRTGTETRWKSKGYSLGPEEKAKLAAEAEQKKTAREQQKARSQQEVAKAIGESLATLSAATVPTPYMASKGVGTRSGFHTGIYTDDEGRTLIPATDVTGKVWTMQRIDASGEKRFSKGGRKHGCFHAVGGLSEVAKSHVLVVAEGYSTAATAAQLLGKPVVAALDSGNLLPVAKALHEKWPDKAVVIVADDDRAQRIKSGHNPGQDKAREAAAAVGGHVVTPVFAPGEQEAAPRAFSDFNDLANTSALGPGGAKRQLAFGVEHALRGQKQKQKQQEKQLRQDSARRSRNTRGARSA